MSVCYLYSQKGDLIQLDATETFTVGRQVSATSSAIWDGSEVSDGINSELKSASFSGIVTATKLRDGISTPVDRIVEYLDDIIDSHTTFTLYGTEDGAIPSISNCILSYNVVRNTETADSLLVDITVKELHITKAIKATGVTLPAKTSVGKLDEKGKKTTGSKKEVDPIPMTQMQKQLLEQQNGSKT